MHHRTFRRAGIAAIALLPALLACEKGTPASSAVATDSAVWVGKENVAIAARETLESGPAISGTLEAERQAAIRAEVGGAVVAILAEPGQAVGRGAVLARIEDAAISDAYESAKAGLRSAEVNAELARRNAARAAELVKAGAIPDRDLETADFQAQAADAQLADARARLTSAARQLGKTVIRAPFAGVVSERPARLGDIVQSGTPLFTLVDPNSLKYEGAVPVEALPGLKVGTPVRFSLSGVDGDLVTGRVSRINPSVDPATRQVRVTVAVPNARGQLLAGLFAEGRVATATREGVVAPSASVDRRGLRPFVVRVRAGRVERVEVELGLIDQARERMEIVQGLAAGDTLLLGGARGLAPGTMVRVGSPAELPAASARTGGER